MRLIFTKDTELKNEIISKLKENKNKYGKPYYPCVNPEMYNDDTICPCKNFRDNVAIGEECHCGLYIKVEQ